MALRAEVGLYVFVEVVVMTHQALGMTRALQHHRGFLYGDVTKVAIEAAQFLRVKGVDKEVLLLLGWRLCESGSGEADRNEKSPES
jgi:hypothetical protein